MKQIVRHPAWRLKKSRTLLENTFVQNKFLKHPWHNDYSSCVKYSPNQMLHNLSHTYVLADLQTTQSAMISQWSSHVPSSNRARFQLHDDPRLEVLLHVAACRCTRMYGQSKRTKLRLAIQRESQQLSSMLVSGLSVSPLYSISVGCFSWRKSVVIQSFNCWSVRSLLNTDADRWRKQHRTVVLVEHKQW